MKKWIDVTWKSSYIGMQRFAFQQMYNNRFCKETLDSMDKKFGQVDQQEIELFQAEVKNLCTWKNLKGEDGYKTYFAYFDVNIDTLETKLRDAIARSSRLGYHSFVVSKEWRSSLKSITDV